jgi:type II secretory pathway pseudopilin PulG
MSPQRRIYVLVAVLAVGTVGGCIALGWGRAPWWALPAMAAAVAIAEFSTARLVVRNESAVGFALTDAVVAIGFVIHPGAWVSVAVAIAVVAANIGRSNLTKVAFNAAQYPAAICVGLLIARSLGGDMLAAAVGLLAFGVVNFLFVAFPVAWMSSQRYFSVISGAGQMTIIHLTGNLSLGLLAAWLAQHKPLGLLGLAAPLLLLWWSYQQQTERASEARLFAELARGQEQAASRSLDSSAQVIVTAAARLFGGAEVEMLLRHPEGLVRYVGSENGVKSRDRVEADAFAEPWVLRTMGARRVRIGNEDGRPYCSAVLGDHDRPLAVLIARRTSRSRSFERLDIRLADVLVGQAEAWLSVANMTARHEAAIGQVAALGEGNKALGQLGAETVPSLLVLRESAERLSRLAYSFSGPDPVREIVDELHSAERAVASLLGAVALASEPELIAGSDGPRSVMQVDSEWTTTGRLEASESR